MGNRSLGASCASRRAAAGLSTLLAASLVVAASPALSQGAMGPGGGAMTPQPRVAPAVPQAPTMTPQAPVVAPQVPQMPVVAPSVNQPVPQPQTRSATSGSNRDHIDQDAQTDIKKLTTSIPSPAQPGPANQTGKANAQGADFVNIDSSNRMTTTPTGPAKPQPNYSNNPIPGIDVVVQKKPAGNAIKQTTGGDGQTTFGQLEAGTYDVALPKVSGGGTVSMTVFVNGTPASRTDFPDGSSTGTFTVAKAGDTVMLKFQTNQQSRGAGANSGFKETDSGVTFGGRIQTNEGVTPTNGYGGTGGGRYTVK